MAHARIRTLCALVGAVLLAGCSGSGRSASPTTRRVPTTVASAPRMKAQLAADRKLAQQAVLRLGDVPDGYKSIPTQNTPADDLPPAVTEAFSTCTHVAPPVVRALLDQRAGPGMVLAASPNFVKSESEFAGTDIASAVELHTSARQLGQELDDLGAPGALGCWKTFLEAAVPNPASSGTSLRTLDVKSVPLRSLGDQSAAVGATITVANGGKTVNESIDFCIVRRGRADAVLMIVVEAGAVDRTLERSLLATMVDRLPTGAGR